MCRDRDKKTKDLVDDVLGSDSMEDIPNTIKFAIALLHTFPLVRSVNSLLDKVKDIEDAGMASFTKGNSSEVLDILKEIRKAADNAIGELE